MPVKTKLRGAGESHMGMVRQNNEDRWHIDADRGIFLVVDGIGGQAAGEKAADIAVNLVRTRLERQTGTAEDRIREGITVANNEIVRLAATNPDWHGMACVLTVAVIEQGSAIVGHVGDSRLYKIRRREIRKITSDHSPVGEREDGGEISEAEAMRHPRRNEVFRDVGSQEHAPDDPDFIEIRRIPFEPDSALLLCSDGLSDQVTSSEIMRAVLANAGRPGGAVHELIEAANRAGGKDNVTILIVEGEQFAGARETLREPAPAGSPFAAKPAIFVYGVICAALVLAGLRYYGLWDRPPVVVPPQTLRVGAGGFASIGQALDKARPGDTVEVPSGEYLEQLRLKNGVTVRGRLPDVPVLRAAAMPNGPAVAIVAEGVQGARVSGFRIRADEKAPLEVAVVIADSDLELQDTEIVGAATGIAIRGKSKAVLRANSIEDCLDTGIRVSGESAPWILYNAILRNGRGHKAPRKPGPGIAIEDPARPVLVGNTFGDNGGDPVAVPAGMETDPITKFNFFLPAKPAARNRGAAH
ncbi:MAG TPA: protein phosphatase 2C domain-containing protein [Bryobacteraceae bacterium]|nr:protein phosphatase 2C domain-containing protein [Bryobacteraceae bacterium]